MAGDNILRSLTRKNFIAGTYYPSDGRHSVYISCVQDKTDIAEQLAACVVQLFDCRVVFHSYSRPVRNTLSSRIKNAISDADAVILIITPKFSSNNDIMAELAAAKQKNIPVVPVLFDGTLSDVSDAEEISGRRMRCAQMSSERFIESLRLTLSDYLTDYSEAEKFEKFYKEKSSAPVDSFTLADKLQYAVGYINGAGTEKNHEKALRMLSLVISSAEESDAEISNRALWERGRVYWLDGNYKLASADWHEAAARGYAPGWFSLGCLYFYGEGTKKNPKKAFNFFNLGANAGCGKACYILGICNLYGIGFEQDATLAEHWFMCGAESDADENNRMLARIYKKSDPLAALKQYERSCSMHEPDSYEYYELASLYGKNDLWKKAVHYYDCAAQVGSKDACLKLGSIYETGKKVDKKDGKKVDKQSIKADKKKANSYYRMAGLVKPSLNDQTSSISSLTTAFSVPEKKEEKTIGKPAEEWKLSPDVAGNTEIWDANPKAHAADMENLLDYTYFDFDPNQKNSLWNKTDILEAQEKAAKHRGKGPSRNMATESGLEDMTSTNKRRKRRRILRRTFTGILIAILSAALCAGVYVILHYFGII